MAGWHVLWLGPQVVSRMQQKQIDGINKTMSECVSSAQGLVHKRTHALEGSIRFEGARPSAGLVTGQWGSFDINYALWQEIAMNHGAKPYLRPSADRYYPNLARNIRNA